MEGKESADLREYQECTSIWFATFSWVRWHKWIISLTILMICNRQRYRIRWHGISGGDYSPEKAGVGGLIPSLATILIQRKINDLQFRITKV